MNTPPDFRVSAEATWLAIGVVIGAAVGVVTGNVALWLPLGLMFGLGAPGLFSRRDNSR